jgi:hypothetical protein
MNVFQMILQARHNPMSVISKCYKIPENLQSSTNGQEIAQYLLDSNQITQNQLNNSMNQSRQPLFRPFFNKK